MNKMRKTVSLILVFVLLAGLYSYKKRNHSDYQIKAKNELKHQLLKDLDSAILLCESFGSHINSPEKSWEDYKKMRLVFKRQEYLLAYLDPQLFNQSLNGAPLPKVQKYIPDFVVLEPKGLQCMEELMYEEKWDKAALQKQQKLFLQALKSYRQRLESTPISDADIFEAFRFGIIRLNSLCINGFDAPAGSDKILSECKSILFGYQNIIEAYQSSSSSKITKKLHRILQLAFHKMEGEWEYFDHLGFLVEVIDPLWKESLKLQKELQIELPYQRSSIPSALNYDAGSLFANNVINVRLFSEYSGGKELAVSRKELGKLLFFDPILSHSNKMACASCHQPERAFTDGLPKSIASKEKFGKRNSPTLINSIYATRFFHDLRADRLSIQVDHVVLNPEEFASSYEEIIKKLSMSEEYQKFFEKAYPRQKISKNSIENALVNYVASLRSFNSEFDKYVRGENNHLSVSAKRGYNLFNGKAACATCHFSPTFAGTVPPYFDDTESEVLGVPEQNKKPYRLDSDLGRYNNGVIKEKAVFYKNAFKTPTLRNIALTAPYMHNGAFATLEEVLEFYNNGGGMGLGFRLDHQTLAQDSLHLNQNEMNDIINFMKSLTDTVSLTSKPIHLPEFLNSNWNSRKIGGNY